MIVSGILDELFVCTTDVFYNFNNGGDRIRQIIGPGLGVSFGGARGISAVGLRVPIEVGIEILTRRRRWGFKALARPFFEVDSVAGAGVRINSIGGGVLAGIGFSRYGLVR